MLYEAVISFEPVDEILKCDCSNECFPVVLFIWMYASWFKYLKSVVNSFKRGHSIVGRFMTLHKVVLTLKSVDEFLKRNIEIEAIELHFPVVLALRITSYHNESCEFYWWYELSVF